MAGSRGIRWLCRAAAVWLRLAVGPSLQPHPGAPLLPSVPAILARHGLPPAHARCACCLQAGLKAKPEIGVQFGVGGDSSVAELAAEGLVHPSWAIRKAKR